MNLLNIIPYKKIDKFNQKFNFLKINNIEDKAKKVIDKLYRSKNINELYVNLLSEWNDCDKLVINSENESQKQLNNEINNLQFSNIENMMMYIDFKYYLPDDILCKVDRSSMINGLETRAPFLDMDVINEAINIPFKYKIQKNTNKVILRKNAYKIFT